jgi:L-alanine-DL-glutamate epimerase-like enolase superfamily enzyme
MTEIVRIEWAELYGERPRSAGCNARLDEHGQRVRVPLARVTTDEGVTGFGWSRVARDETTEWVGHVLTDVCDLAGGLRGHCHVRDRARAIEYPLWDLMGQLAEQPVYALLGGRSGEEGSFLAPCYDTSLYMDDLCLEDKEAAELIASEALEGAARGHRAFKIKVGRGAMHMPLEAGTRRDIRVIQAVREAVGPEATIMVDANNGYNLNLARRVLAETALAEVYWIEEAFHEDGRLYERLKEWMAAEGLETLIADGEGAASPYLLDWAREGLIDVVQYDILYTGFTRWLELGPQLDGWGVRSAPHHYGNWYGNYAACHLASFIQRFEFVEWDEATVPGLDASAYRISQGMVRVPDLPGFGMRLEEGTFVRAVEENGFVVEKE